MRSPRAPARCSCRAAALLRARPGSPGRLPLLGTAGGRPGARVACGRLARRLQDERAGVQWIAGDLSDRIALELLVDEAEAVIHLAGTVNAPDSVGFEAANVEGTLNLVEAAVAARVGRFVHVSSLSAR